MTTLLKKQLESTNPAIRRKALLTLCQNYPQRSLGRLKRALLHDPSPVIRHEGAFLLGELKEKGAIPSLIKVIKNDTSDLVRHEAIEALGDIGIKSKQVISVLKSLKKDKVLFIAETASIALSTLLLQKKEGNSRH